MTTTMTTENTMYGYGYLYPGLFTPEEALKFKAMVRPKLWSFALDICAAGGVGNYYISAVSSLGTAVVLTNKEGIGALELAISAGDENPQYAVKNWHRHLKLRGKNRSVIQSTNRSYLIKQMAVHFDPLLSELKGRIQAQLVNCAQYMGSWLNDETSAAYSIATTQLKADTAYPLLRMVFDPTYNKLELDSATMTKLEDIYKNLHQKVADKDDYMTRFKDIFDQPKWVIGSVPHYDNKYLMFGSAKFVPLDATSYGGSFKVTFEREPRLYRNLEHIYATYPDDAGSIKSALMFCKVHREKESLPAVRSHDAEGFLPYINGVYEDIGGITYGAASVPNISTPHWLLLDK